MSLREVPVTSLPEAHHPDAERLALHAAGQLRPLERVVLEAHLAFCAPCVERLRELLEPGARWLQSVGREPVSASLWDRLDRRLAESEPLPSTAPRRQRPTGAAGASSIEPPPGLPAAAWDELDPRPAIRWRPVVSSRARFTVLGSDPVLDADLVLVGLEGGSRFPAHLHRGHEDVVILAGGYRDAFGHFETGAYHRYAPGTEHGPDIDAGEHCWTVGLIESGVRFRGLLGVLQWLVDPKARRRRPLTA